MLKGWDDFAARIKTAEEAGPEDPLPAPRLDTQKSKKRKQLRVDKRLKTNVPKWSQINYNNQTSQKNRTTKRALSRN